jgi:hypothetical protein
MKMPRHGLGEFVCWSVIPAKAGTQVSEYQCSELSAAFASMGSGLRRNDAI